MTVPGKLNLEIEQGADWAKSLLWKDSDGNPVDLTNFTARMHVRETFGAADPLVELTTENGRIALGGAAGTIDLSLDNATTTALEYTDGRAPFVYDLELVAGAGQVTRLVYGKVKVKREVTHD